jgi:hypothetical protein
MTQSYVVTGTVTDARTVTLDEPLPIESQRVRIIVAPVTPTPKRPYLEVMEELRRDLRERGHTPRTKEEVDAYLQAERDSWNER